MRTFTVCFTKPSVTTAAVFISVAVVSLASGVLLQRKAENALHHEVRQNLVRLARVAALHVDGDRHLQWKPQDAFTPEYRKAIAPFYRLMEASRDIYDIYTCVLRDGKVYFVLGTPDYDPKTGKPDYSYLNKPYDEATPEMLRALRSGVAIAENRLYTDQWGTVISGYAPIRDSAGKLVGIVGVDLHVNEYRERLAAIRHHARITYVLVLGASILIGAVVYALSRRAMRVREQLRLHARALEMAGNAIVITAFRAEYGITSGDGRRRLARAARRRREELFVTPCPRGKACAAGRGQRGKSESGRAPAGEARL
ncbi:MAG: cache domain-containing protein [Armatimonadota bacterium]